MTTKSLSDLTIAKEEASAKLATLKMRLNTAETGYKIQRSLAMVDGTIDELAKERGLEKTTESTKAALLDTFFGEVIEEIARLQNEVALAQHQMDCARWELNLGYTEWGLTQKHGEEWYE